MEFDTQSILSKYQLVPRTLIFVEKGEEILLIHKKKIDSYGFSKLNGIGGHIEIGEEPFEAAKREIKEESGLLIDFLYLVAIIFIDIGKNPGVLLFVFKAEYPGGKLKASEEGDLLWLEKESIRKTKNIVKDMRFLIDIIDSYTVGSPPTIAKYRYTENGELRIVINS